VRPLNQQHLVSVSKKSHWLHPVAPVVCPLQYAELAEGELEAPALLLSQMSVPASPFSFALFPYHSQYAELAEGEREAWAKEQGADSALPKIITTGFKAIHLIYFFTAGADEVKCWQIRKNSKAPQVCGGGSPAGIRRRI
jgi:hypothetical protein